MMGISFHVSHIRSQLYSSLASPRGFEPPTPGLGIPCSIRLSYGDARTIHKPNTHNFTPAKSNSRQVQFTAQVQYPNTDSLPKCRAYDWVGTVCQSRATYGLMVVLVAWLDTYRLPSATFHPCEGYTDYRR